jgi:hypothetical protein
LAPTELSAPSTTPATFQRHDSIGVLVRSRLVRTPIPLAPWSERACRTTLPPSSTMSNSVSFFLSLTRTISQGAWGGPALAAEKGGIAAGSLISGDCARATGGATRAKTTADVTSALRMASLEVGRARDIRVRRPVCRDARALSRPGGWAEPPL